MKTTFNPISINNFLAINHTFCMIENSRVMQYQVVNAEKSSLLPYRLHDCFGSIGLRTVKVYGLSRH